MENDKVETKLGEGLVYSDLKKKNLQCSYVYKIRVTFMPVNLLLSAWKVLPGHSERKFAPHSSGKSTMYIRVTLN